MTRHSSLVPYYLSKVFVIVETKDSVLDNIPMNVKNQTNADNLHPEENLLTHKAEISSIVNTLIKIIISIYLYETYVSHFYDNRYVELFHEEFYFCKTTF